MSNSKGQGIEGKVIWQEGNFMPSPGETKPSVKRIETTIRREVRIYELTGTDEVEKSTGTIFTNVQSPLVKTISTEEDGSFRVDLPPGSYSVFTVEEEGLFANSFDSEGNICPVTVEQGQFTNLVIKVNYKAYY
jgi:hypothetical protein